jgi:hypothetical protein
MRTCTCTHTHTHTHRRSATLKGDESHEPLIWGPADTPWRGTLAFLISPWVFTLPATYTYILALKVSCNAFLWTACKVFAAASYSGLLWLLINRPGPSELVRITSHRPVSLLISPLGGRRSNTQATTSRGWPTSQV